MPKQSRHYQVLVSERIGGAEKLAMQIHQFRAARGGCSNELLIPAGGDAEKVARTEAMRFTTYDLPGLMNRNPFVSWPVNLGLFRKLGLGVQSTIHVHSPFVYGALRPLLELSRARVILHLHLDYTAQELAWSLKHAPDLIIVCAQFLKERVAGIYPARTGRNPRIAVARNAVDTEVFYPLDKRVAKQNLGIPGDRPMFLMAANLALHKGQETAIQAASILKSNGQRPLFWFVGEEREGRGFEKHLRLMADRLDISDSIRFEGYRNDVAALMRAADFLLLPSTQEGLPLSVLEAQASRAIVLAAPTAGIPEVVEHGRTGLLIAANDPQGYAAAAVSLLHEPARARAIADAAYEQVIAGFTWPEYMQRIDAEYASLLTGTRG